jgi:hypothetical protein
MVGNSPEPWNGLQGFTFILLRFYFISSAALSDSASVVVHHVVRTWQHFMGQRRSRTGHTEGRREALSARGNMLGHVDTC